MFGYIKINKDELKIKDFNAYHAYYCGLCQNMSFHRLFLSYDFVFLYMLYASLNNQKETFSTNGCKLCGIKKELTLDKNETLKRIVDISNGLLYEKKIDNINDEKLPRKLFYYLFSFKNNGLSLYEKQKQIEEKPNSNIDELCSITAETLANILEDFSNKEKEKRVLNRLGYMLGRYIYLCDAVDDYQEDIKNHRFNPFIKNCNIADVKGMLNLTITEIANAYCLLEIDSNHKAILDNIIFQGLQSTCDTLFKEGNNV